MPCGYERERTIWQLLFVKNKWTSVFHVYVLILTMNFVITLSKWSADSRRSATLTMLWRNSLSTTRQTNEKLTSTLRRRNLKTQQSPAILDLCPRKTRAGKSRDYCDVIVSKKLPFQTVFCPPVNTRPAFLNPSAWRAFIGKTAFSWRISVNGRPSRSNTAAFLNFSCKVWRLP